LARDKDHLPVEWVQIARAPQWDFSAARRLPGGWINNAFETWDGRAGVRWPDRGLELEIVASERLKACIVYSPGKDADFFCFEPVSHPVDAHNLAPSEDRGLAVLAHGETFDAWCRFHPKRVVRP
jgi:aldose 1-epimerase